MVHSIDISLLKKIISIPSAYPNEMELGSFIAGMFIKKGYEVILQKVEGERYNVIVEKGKGKKTILLYNHLDTVAPVGGWNTKPHNPIIVGDRLYGLGAYDMKGGMVANIETFLQVEPKHVKLRMLFCVDEENISKGGHAYANSRFMKDTDCVLSPEPGFAHGVQGVVTGRIGRAVISITLKKPPVHFFYYEPGADIQIVSSRVILALGKLFKKQGDRKEFIFVRRIASQTTGMSTPSEVVMELDSSVLPPLTNSLMLEKVKETLKKETKDTGVQFEAGFKERETPFLSGYEIDGNNQYLDLMKQSIAEITKKQAVPYFRSSVADENIFGAMGKSVLGVGPVGGNAHAANEWVSIASLRKLHEIYMNFVRLVEGEAGSFR